MSDGRLASQHLHAVRNGDAIQPTGRRVTLDAVAGLDNEPAAIEAGTKVSRQLFTFSSRNVASVSGENGDRLAGLAVGGRGMSH
jgi:hypothetical protein